MNLYGALLNYQSLSDCLAHSKIGELLELGPSQVFENHQNRIEMMNVWDGLRWKGVSLQTVNDKIVRNSPKSIGQIDKCHM